MKHLFALLLLVLCMGVTPAFAATPTMPDTEQAPGGIKGYCSYFSGSIGNDYDCYLGIWNGEGFYNYNGGSIERNLKVTQLNAQTGKLVFKAYDKRGRYVGQFVGKITIINKRTGEERLTGVFTNTKGGKVNFDMYTYLDM